MKKRLYVAIFLSLSISPSFAVQCTEQQYNIIFYLNSDSSIDTGIISSVDGSKVFVDGDSVNYDRTNQTMELWKIHQLKSDPSNGIFKTRVKFDLKNNRVQIIAAHWYACNGGILDSLNVPESKRDWDELIPGSMDRLIMEKMKKLLKISDEKNKGRE